MSDKCFNNAENCFISDVYLSEINATEYTLMLFGGCSRKSSFPARHTAREYVLKCLSVEQFQTNYNRFILQNNMYVCMYVYMYISYS